MDTQVQCPNCGGFKVETEETEAVQQKVREHITLPKYYKNIAGSLLLLLMVCAVLAAMFAIAPQQIGALAPLFCVAMLFFALLAILMIIRIPSSCYEPN
jgi:FtsH-binding integral membrane protein